MIQTNQHTVYERCHVKHAHGCSKHTYSGNSAFSKETRPSTRIIKTNSDSKKVILIGYFALAGINLCFDK